MEKFTQNHHPNCKPKITAYNQTQIAKEEEENAEIVEEQEGAKEERSSNNLVESPKITVHCSGKIFPKSPPKLQTQNHCL